MPQAFIAADHSLSSSEYVSASCPWMEAVAMLRNVTGPPWIPRASSSSQLSQQAEVSHCLVEAGVPRPVYPVR